MGMLQPARASTASTAASLTRFLLPKAMVRSALIARDDSGLLRWLHSMRQPEPSPTVVSQMPCERGRPTNHEGRDHVRSGIRGCRGELTAKTSGFGAGRSRWCFRKLTLVHAAQRWRQIQPGRQQRAELSCQLTPSPVCLLALFQVVIYHTITTQILLGGQVQVEFRLLH